MLRLSRRAVSGPVGTSHTPDLFMSGFTSSIPAENGCFSCVYTPLCRYAIRYTQFPSCLRREFNENEAHDSPTSAQTPAKLSSESQCFLTLYYRSASAVLDCEMFRMSRNLFHGSRRWTCEDRIVLLSERHCLAIWADCWMIVVCIRSWLFVGGSRSGSVKCSKHEFSDLISFTGQILVKNVLNEIIHWQRHFETL